jgi:hypothetical protein
LGTSKAVTFELLLADYTAMAQHLLARASAFRWSSRLLIFGTVFISVVVARLFGRSGRAFLAGVLVGLVLFIGNRLLTTRQLKPRPGGAWLCQYDVELTEGGVHVQTPNWKCDLPWHGVIAVEETHAHCFLRVDNYGVYTIPKRAFPNDEAVQQFVDFAHECVSRARGTQGAA